VTVEVVEVVEVDGLADAPLAQQALADGTASGKQVVAIAGSSPRRADQPKRPCT